MEELIEGLVYYKIFDKQYKDSTHIYSPKENQSISLNVIEGNKKSITNYFKVNNLLVLKQVHGNIVIDADNCDISLVHKADGSITTKKNLILAIQTADCVPVMLSSNDGKVIGAAHCGWRGAKANIIKNIVKAMKKKGAKSLKAIIGPAIAQSSYEVDSEFYSDFISENWNNSKFFIRSSPGYYKFDLVEYVIANLQAEGVTDIKNSAEDTYSNPIKYPSYRYCNLHKLEDNQRILSTIVMKYR